MIKPWMGQKEIEEQLKRWKILLRQDIVNELSYDYKSKSEQEKKIRIVPALVFWKFIRDNLTYISWGERLEFLHQFVGDSNPMVKIVAMVESMPDEVWHRILEKYNIEFSSFECLLRRLDVEQIEAITCNYIDLCVDKKLPRVYGKLGAFFSADSYGSLFDSKINPDERYLSKGAMCDDMLGLDFGFNKYPGGPDDDTVKSYSWVGEKVSDFLAIGKHIEDFVVNWKHGKYGKMFRIANSNYLWGADKILDTNEKHFCPGFHFTMTVHTMFWLSMLMCIFKLPFSNFVEMSIFGGLSVLVFSAFAPTVFLLAAVKFIARFIRDKILPGKLFTIAECIFYKIFLPIWCVALIVFVVYISWVGLEISFGWIQATMFIAALIAYFACKIITTNPQGEPAKFTDFPWWLQVILLIVAEIAVIHGLDAYGEFILRWLISISILTFGIIFHFIANICVSIYDFVIDMFMTMRWLLLIMVTYLALFGAFAFMFLLPEKTQEKIFVTLGNFAAYSLYFTFAALITSLIIGVLNVKSMFNSFEFVAIQTAGLVILFGIKYASCYFNPARKEWKNVISHHNYYSYPGDEYELNSYYFGMNKWLVNLEKNEKKILFPIIGKLAYTIYPASGNFIERGDFVQEINAKTLEVFEKNLKIILNIDEDLQRHFVVQNILQGKTFETAMFKGEKKYRRTVIKNKLIEKLVSSLAWIFKPITFILGLVYLALKICVLFIWGFFGSLFLGSFMKKICPYTFRQKRLI